MSFGRLVVLAAIAVAAMVLHLMFGRGGPPMPPLPGGAGNNPAGALYVRDLGRLPDGRHTFDLVYALVLRNDTARPFVLDSLFSRLAVGDVTRSGDVLDMNEVSDPETGTMQNVPAPALVWHRVADTAQHNGMHYPPGEWRKLSAHYRINARPEQLADMAISYDLRPEPHGLEGWFAHPPMRFSYHEEVQLGAVLRAHCALGVKVQNAEPTSPCG